MSCLIDWMGVALCWILAAGVVAGCVCFVVLASIEKEKERAHEA